MRLRKFAFSALAAAACFPHILSAGANMSPMTIPHRFPFDVSDAQKSLSTRIEILNFREYYFALQFDYFGQEDLYRVLKLVGNGAVYANGRYATPGVVIPVHLTVSRIDGNTNNHPLFDKTINVQGSYSHGFTDVKFNGNYSRLIASIPLRPGIYNVQLNTVKESKEFSGIPAYLNVEFHSKALPSN